MRSLFEGEGGWIFLKAKLNLERDKWVAEAGHDDGRSLVCEVPGWMGPVAAEEGVKAMLP